MILRFILPLLLSASALAQQEAAKVHPDLQRSLDGRSKVDALTDEQLSKIAQDSILLKRMGLNADVLKQAIELQKQERDALFSNEKAEMIKEIITVSTDPSAPSPVIYTTPGHETFVNVIDQTGEPWPLVMASSGNNLLFEAEAVEAHTYKNVFKLRSLERVGSSNATLLLQDKALSISIRIENSKEKYHPQPILQITEAGPNAKASYNLSPSAEIRNSKLMKNLMFGVAPEGFKSLESSHSQLQAWKGVDGELYIKTKLHPINPRPTSTYSGPNGYSTYELDYWPVLIMGDDNGIEHQVNISGE
ncbi:DotH/IcmK family type IV secretion protein [Pseudoalteromonas nigrifaciens]|uniref:DotH/IcmK family type IV secretion protein n=1 Tax=Pseudoalteromonas nigrifaciens TaxID=28109 RepID=UPI003FD33417